jgi:hypothetical protein
VGHAASALIGGTLLWLWGAVAHMFLPIGMMGFRIAIDQDAAINTLQSTAAHMLSSSTGQRHQLMTSHRSAVMFPRRHGTLITWNRAAFRYGARASA